MFSTRTASLATATIGFAIGLRSTPLAAQKADLEYNWRTSELTNVARLKSGSLIRFRLIGLNTLCYDYEISITQFAAKEELPDIIGLFSGTAIPKAVPAGEAERGAAAPIPGNEIETAIGRIEDSVKSLEKQIGGLAKDINRIGDAHTSANQAVTALYQLACPAGGSRGSTVTPTTPQFTAVIEKLEALKAALPAIPRLDSLSQRAGQSINATKVFITDFSGRPATEREPFQVRLLGAQARLQAVETALGTIRSGPLEAVKKIDGRQVAASIDNVTRAVGVVDIVRTAIVNANTDSLTIVVTAKGKSEIAAVKGAVLTDPLTFPVTRKHRTFASGGFLVSLLDDHHFVRANRSAGVAANPDSTFSTIVDAKNGTGLAFGPTVLLSTTLGAVLGADLGISAGVVVRTEAKPEYLVGLSIGIADRILITPAIHFGRIETLLLGADVAKGPVPSAVTLDTAVGEKWRGVLALVVSYRL